MYEDFAKRYNKLYLNVKSLLEKAKERDDRIWNLENKVVNLNDILKKGYDNDIREKIKHVEAESANNFNKLTNIESEVREVKQVQDKRHSDREIEFDKLKRKFYSDTVNLQKGIHDLDEKISDLDEEYKTMQNSILQVKTHQEEDTDKAVEQLTADFILIKDDLKKGKITPTRTERNKCEICDIRFQSKGHLDCHFKAKHCKIHSCNQCEAEFQTSWQLESHMKTHEMNGKYLCTTCGKSFHLQWRLAKHITMHQNEKILRKCHFYNNSKDCPFEEIGCKFLHEKSKECKFKSKCKLDKCQYRH